MNKQPSKSEIEFFVVQTISSLPDSLRQRKTILSVLFHLLPKGCEQAISVRTMLETLQAHEDTQLTFSALFRSTGDGHNP